MERICLFNLCFRFAPPLCFRQPSANVLRLKLGSLSRFEAETLPMGVLRLLSCLFLSFSLVVRSFREVGSARTRTSAPSSIIGPRPRLGCSLLFSCVRARQALEPALVLMRERCIMGEGKELPRLLLRPPKGGFIITGGRKWLPLPVSALPHIFITLTPSEQLSCSSAASLTN